MLLLLVTADIVPSPPILVTLMMEAIHCSETSDLATATRRNIPEDRIPYSYRSETSNLTYTQFVCFGVTEFLLETLMFISF
jgi:hypothetical protein